jgi:aldose 1-epimerase
MFSLNTDTFGGFTRYKLFNGNTGEYITFIPECGGILQELVLQKDGHLHSIIDGVTEEELPDNNWFKSSILFPFPSRIPDGKYTFEGKEYQLPINESSRNTSLHGLVFNKIFTFHEGSLELVYEGNGEEAGFPFRYLLKVRYELGQNGEPFQMRISASSLGENKMPCGIGWHPYFKTGTVIDKLKLTLPTEEYTVFNESLIPTGEIRTMPEFKEGSLIAETELDTGFIKRDAETTETCLFDSEKQLTIRISQKTTQKDAPAFIQVYTPPHRQSIAIEPQTCGTNAFNNGNGLVALSSGEVLELVISIKLQ